MGATKRAGANDSSPQPLTCVRVVCQNGPDILQMPHIVDKLSEYLDSSRKWTLPKACASNSPYLVRRLASQKAEGPASFLHRPKYRQWQFDRSLLKAVEVGNLEIAQLLAEHFGDCHLSRKVVKVAAGRGRTEILKRMDGWGCEIEWHVEAVLEAIRNGYFELANWLQEKLPTTSVDYMGQTMTERAVAAANKGDLDMVKRYCEMLTERDSDGSLRYMTDHVNLWRAVQRATDSGRLHVLQWMMDEPNRKVLLFELRGREFERISGVGIDLSLATAGRHINVLTWLIEHYPKYCIIGNAGNNAARYGNLDILRLLLSAPIEKRIAPNLIAVAAENGHLDIVKFLLAEGYPVNKAMDNAAGNGFLGVVKWLHGNTSHSCSARAMDGAASNGHLDVVKWLHDNREEGCTINAMRCAAGQGHLLVVQWLHENRKEGCTTSAMDAAAGNGHLDVVKWLHSTRLEGCTTEAMDVAARNNHLDVLQWLDQNRTEGFTSKAINLAVRCGNFKVFQWLFSRRPELCVASLMNDAVIGSRFDIVWFLHHNHSEYGSVESLKKALINRPVLEPISQEGFAEWAYAHHRQEFERNIAEHLFD